MKNKEKEIKENTFFQKVNNNINKLSKTSLILIVFVYAIALACVYALFNTNDDYIVTPNYKHVQFDENINPQISIVAIRNFDSNNKMTLKYQISANIYGRISEESEIDPYYQITNFKMSASTVENTKSKKENSVYYFQEQNSYKTPVTHSYTIDNSTVDQHPSIFYVLLQYKKAGVEKISTFKEEVMLQPSSNDIEKLENYYLNNGSLVSSINFKNKSDVVIGNLQFISTDVGTEYNAGVKISMKELSYATRHHIDMQSWIETSTGEYLPFVGVYSYSSQKSQYSQSSKSINKQLNPKYICAKLKYYYSDTEYDEFYFKQDITNLADAFSSTPLVGDDLDNNDIASPNKTKTFEIFCGCAIGVVGTIVAIAVIYFVIRKKDTKEKEIVENKNNLKENHE